MFNIIVAIIKDYFLLVNWLNNSVACFEDVNICFRMFWSFLVCFCFHPLFWYRNAVPDSSVQWSLTNSWARTVKLFQSRSISSSRELRMVSFITLHRLA